MNVILKNLYQGENSVKMMIRNGEKIYQQLTKFVFDVDKDSIEFPASGGTDTLTITANENWAMTVPAWVSASALSGKTSATITLTSQPTEETLEGDIVITCNGVQKTVSVAAGAHDYSKDYLTIEALEDGVYNVTGNKSKYYYSINGGEWVATQIETYDPTPITLQVGDVVRFKGNNAGQELFWGTEKKFNIYGNIMSLQYLDDFKDKTSYYTHSNNFYGMCYNSGVVDAKNLVLPVLTLNTSDYKGMFNGCANLTSAPILPATTIANETYYQMFKGCTKLNYVKCLATTSTKPGWSGVLVAGFWLQNASATGTFVKATGANWQSGISGIPSGWTVIEE